MDFSCESIVKSISIFNHVLGPVMRGPSSSHTAGAYHIACMVRSLLRAEPRSVTLAMDPTGSYAATFVPQGADRAFAMGLLNRPLTETSFFSALEAATSAGMEVRYEIRSLAAAHASECSRDRNHFTRCAHVTRRGTLDRRRGSRTHAIE